MKAKLRQWPNVYKRVHRGGQAGFVVDLGLINGKREQHSFKTKGEADSFAELKRIERRNQGARAILPFVKVGRLVRFNKNKCEQALIQFETKSIFDI